MSRKPFRRVHCSFGIGLGGIATVTSHATQSFLKVNVPFGQLNGKSKVVTQILVTVDTVINSFARTRLSRFGSRRLSQNPERGAYCKKTNQEQVSNTSSS